MFLDKVLSVFAFPLGLGVLASALCLAALILRWRRLATIFATLAVLVLWTASMPAFARFAALTLESDYPPLPTKDTPGADVAIVLGGGIRARVPGEPYADLTEAADRIVHAARLWRAGKVSKILVTGGGALRRPGEEAEADAMVRLLVELGVDSRTVLVETESRNTRENAALSRPIWDAERFRTGLLVTSAMHMPRALATFRNLGFSVSPASTDAQAGTLRTSMPFLVLPDIDALRLTTGATKECLGFVVYRLRGWI